MLPVGAVFFGSEAHSVSGLLEEYHRKVGRVDSFSSPHKSPLPPHMSVLSPETPTAGGSSLESDTRNQLRSPVNILGGRASPARFVASPLPFTVMASPGGTASTTQDAEVVVDFDELGSTIDDILALKRLSFRCMSRNDLTDFMLVATTTAYAPASVYNSVGGCRCCCLGVSGVPTSSCLSSSWTGPRATRPCARTRPPVSSPAGRLVRALSATSTSSLSNWSSTTTTTTVAGAITKHKTGKCTLKKGFC